MKNSLSPQTPVRSLLKMRPMAIAVMDKRNIKFWDSLDQPLGNVVSSDHLENFLEEISFVQSPASDTEWNAMPLYCLVEYLTHEHRDFQLQEIADMAHVLDIHTLADSEEAEGLRRIQREFQDFAKDIRNHMEEEETFLFPKILRYEACMRDNHVHPEFHKGSVQAYMAMRLAQDSRSIRRSLEALVASIAGHAERHEGSFAAQELLEIVTRFRERLDHHRELEANALFPIARELERNLYNLSIGGDPAVAYNRRGPMDSGIRRLEE
jgi:iron-sulfur cluster repair protein YtfE (RIC family)